MVVKKASGHVFGRARPRRSSGSSSPLATSRCSWTPHCLPASNLFVSFIRSPPLINTVCAQKADTRLTGRQLSLHNVSHMTAFGIICCFVFIDVTAIRQTARESLSPKNTKSLMQHPPAVTSRSFTIKSSYSKSNLSFNKSVLGSCSLLQPSSEAQTLRNLINFSLLSSSGYSTHWL